MDRSWMYGRRETKDFMHGVSEFCMSALQHQASTGVKEFYCPCADCENVNTVNNVLVIRDHVFMHGFRPNYHVWVYHGESGVYVGNSSKNVVHEQEEAIYAKGEADCFEDEDDDDVENNIDDDNDRVEDMLHEVEDEVRDRVFECLSKAAETPLYPGCTKYSKLSAVCTLYNIKTSGGWTDISFTELLVALSDMLPAGNELPRSNYYAKKLMCPFGLEYKKIHACPNDCLLYHKKYENLDKCPRCGVLRYKRKGVSEGKNVYPAKVLWYLPIIPRFKRLFSIKKDARNLRWHADPDRRKRDGLLRHPANSPQWKTIDKLHDTFGKEPRNLRLGLCTDGMNPFGTLSSQHSTWPVLLVIYNLPPWLCMKRKYIMLSLLISGPKQPGNEIDVYLEPLVDDLRKMWDEGVSVFDAHANETFRLRAMLFCTINDFPAHGNLSGYKNKGMKACPTCEEDTQSKYISECHKYVFLRT
ncbi:uncharacterized protein [Spinacia oleracea]|uniref:Transposase-associated domain-containing protein n=1 Tax=Spinacia oleracea TaxID=3562 RepID=A0ABM3RRL5_SPIOL|nr:uncharacterized protein LOC110797474 [Spinacia oleracea]